MALTFRSMDDSKALARPSTVTSRGPDVQLRTAVIPIKGPDNVPVMTAHVARDASGRLATLQSIRLWSFLPLIGILAAVALVTIALVLKLTRRIAFEEANEWCKVAMDNMSQGLCMFDAEQRVVVCNDRYPAMYGLDPELTKPGTHLRDIVRHRIARGVYDEGGTPEDYLKRARRRASPAPPPRCMS